MIIASYEECQKIKLFEMRESNAQLDKQYQKQVYWSNSILIVLTLLTFCYIRFYKSQTKDQLTWVFFVQALIVVGCYFGICKMRIYIKLNVSMTAEINRKSAIFTTLSYAEFFGFTLFAFTYFLKALKTKMLIDGKIS